MIATKQALEKTIETLGDAIPRRYISEFNKVKEKNLKHLESNGANNVDLNSFVVRERFVKFFGKIHKAGLTELQENKAEHVDRLIDLLFFFDKFLKYERISLGEKDLIKRDYIVSLKNKLNKCIWWFCEQGIEEDLDWLEKIKAKTAGEIKRDVTEAQQKIVNRHLKYLLEFFDIDSSEIITAVEEMIANRRIEPFAKLPEMFVPESFSQALTQLSETKRLARELLIEEDIKDWLNTPQKVLLSKTPRDAILAGKGFRVLQILIRFGEGIY